MNIKINLFSFYCIFFFLLCSSGQAQSSGEDSIEVTLLNYYNITDGFIEQNKLQQALHTCEETEALMKQFPDVRNHFSSTLFSQHAKVLYKLNRYKEAEMYFDKGLLPVHLSIAALKSGKWNMEVFIASEFMGTIKDAGDYFVYKGLAQSSKENLRIGIEVLNKAIKTSLNQQNFLFETGISEGFGSQNTTLFEDLLSVLFKSRTILDEDRVMENAFSTIESAKANLLKNVVWEEAGISEMLPDTVNALRLKMKNEVQVALNSVRENNSNENESRFISERESYMEYLQKIRKDFGLSKLPDQTPVSANDIRLTQFKGTIMNYFLGEKYLYIFIHSGYRKYFICKKIPDNFEKDLELIKNNYLTKQGTSDTQSINELKRISREWYQWLLSNVEIKDELVIIPHRELSFISFELLDANEKGRSTHYVIEKHPVRYEISASCMFARPHKKTKTNLKYFGGFATSNDSSVLETEGEIKSVADIMNGDVYLNAKPSDFFTNADNYRVLHITARAVAADRDSFKGCNILFETDNAGNNLVRDMQIAALKLNTRMIVFIARNIGLGQTNISENIVSLSRSFFIAGSPAVVVSLWPVNDTSTVEIMTAFYSYLKKRQTKSEALRHAKLDYLKNETNPARKHPYYWAGFILTGNNSPLPAPDFLKAHWGKIVLVIAALFIVLIYFRVRANKSAG
ncbi:MAG: CHAT domain-containing protein [Bacteroidia bacterium]